MTQQGATQQGAQQTPLPKTVEELKAEANQGKRCTTCRAAPATMTVSITLAHMGTTETPRGATAFTVPRVAVCEPCGAQVVGLAKRNLKA